MKIGSSVAARSWIVRLASTVLVLGLAACDVAGGSVAEKAEASPEASSRATAPPADGLARATFAGGCFWCMEGPFEALDGVRSVVSGYTGGAEVDPSYDEVSRGRTSHVEAVEVVYDPTKLSYEQLLETFWRQIDPTDPGGQFADRGAQYRTAIFVHDEAQRAAAEAAKSGLDESGKFDRPIVTEIRDAAPFYPAEEYHQDFYKKNPARYNQYKVGSGRTGYIARVWADEPKRAKPPMPEPKSDPAVEPAAADAGQAAGGAPYRRPSDEEIRAMLTPEQYQVTQRDGTERPWTNEYWNHKEPGIYVDVVSGEPLFSSTDKYDSRTGWPSFTRPLVPEAIVEHQDRSLGMARTEVRSKVGDSHLGHLFPDGPAPTGLRYCINSAALRFVHRDELAEQGYEEFLDLFERQAAK